jgi:hypothetical protein
MTMRFLRCAGLALALVGCAGPIRPAVSPALSSLPDESEEREERVASAAVRPSPETGRSSSEGEQVETAAAGLAAFLGMLFSSTENSILGFSVPIEETRLVAPKPTPSRTVEPEPPVEPAPPEPLPEIRAPSPRR